MINATSGNAIPWNGSNAAILQSASGLAYPLNFADEYGTYFSADYSNFIVIAPDNTIYSGATGSATYSSAQQTPLPPVPPGVAPIQNSEGSGAVRRLATVSSSTMRDNPYIGVAGVFSLPAYDGSLFKMQPAITTLPTGQMPATADKAVMGAHAYVGLIGELDRPQKNGQVDLASPTIDAGVIYAPEGYFAAYDAPKDQNGHQQLTHYPAPWSPTIRIADGRANNGYPAGTDTTAIDQSPARLSPWVGVTQPVVVAITVQLVGEDMKACKVLITAGDTNRVINIPALVGEKFATYAKSGGTFGNLRRSAYNYRMKRVVSIDKKVEFPASSLFKTSWKGVGFARPWGMFLGAYQDGSSLQGVSHRGYLVKKGDDIRSPWPRWTKPPDPDLTDHSKDKTNTLYDSTRSMPIEFPDAFATDFMAQWITNSTPGNPVKATDPHNSLVDEIVNITLSP